MLHPSKHHLVTNIGEKNPDLYLACDYHKLESVWIEINSTNLQNFPIGAQTTNSLHPECKRGIIHHLALAGGQQRVGSLITPKTVSEYALITHEMTFLK